MITLQHHFEEIRRVTRLEVEKRLTNNLSMAARIAEMRGDIDRMYSVINESILRDQIQLGEMVGAVRHQADSSDYYEHHTSAGESSLSTDGSHQSAITIIPGATYTTETTATTRRTTRNGEAIENDNVGAQQQSVAHAKEVVQVNDSTPPPAVQAQIVSVQMNEDESYFDRIDMKELEGGDRIQKI